MNNKIKSNETEFKIIEILNDNKDLSQRSIAQKADISLGLTNILIKRLVHKGFIKIRNMNKRKILYNLTPKAIIEKSYRTYNYFQRSVKDIVTIRKKIQNEIMKKAPQEREIIYISGANEISEIARWAIQEINLKPVLLEKTEGIEINDNDLVINCNQEFINKKNFINIFEIL